ncbi:uncharacterized protein LOC118749352 [Rhagoletis pomonella]|uniref:uncharacterized protein LOC118749352 n=1 Tax=Rhagoletis pomonella TaxID=28610 RepID=UPI00177D39BE|nr:uncharacterized protein LOC118749352 [Rhagoletis pomonella]
MDKYLRPESFDIEPSDNSATRACEHWRKRFESFIAAQEPAEMDGVTQASWDETKHRLLINQVSPSVYVYFSEARSFREAVDLMDKLYVKPKNVLFARHALATRRQRSDENIETYLQALKQLSKYCEFAAVDADTNRSDCVRDAFISGISSNSTRQRLLENLTLTLDQAYNQALSLETAEVNSLSFNSIAVNAVTDEQTTTNHQAQQNVLNGDHVAAASFNRRKCFFCGGQLHLRKNCPAREETCQLCNKKGHLATVCKSAKSLVPQVASRRNSTVCITAASPHPLHKATVPAIICGFRAEALLDTGSSVSFINEKFANKCGFKKDFCNATFSMASLSHTSKVESQTSQSITLGDHKYDNVNLLIVKNLCSDLIIGHDVLQEHSSLEFSFGGPKNNLHVCNVAEASVPPVSLFPIISPDCKPVAITSRRYNDEDSKFIKAEIEKL